MSIGKQLTKNVLTSWITHAVRLAVGFLFVPYIARTLGGGRYGAWVIMFQTIAYLTLLDFGISQGLVRFVSSHFSRRDFSSISRLLSTATVLYGGIGVLTLVGTLGLRELLPLFMTSANASVVAEAREALSIIAGLVALRFWFAPYNNSFAGVQRLDIQNILDICEEFARTAGLVILLAAGQDLVSLAWVVLGVGAARQLAGVLLFRKLYPDVRLRLESVDRSVRRDLMGYSKVVFGITVCLLLIYNADSLLLGAMVSSVAAGVYAPGAQVMLYLRQLVNGIGLPLTPVVSHYDGIADHDRVRQIYLKGVRYVSFAAAGVAVGVIIFARPFVALWLAPEFAVSGQVMMIMAVGTLFLLPQIVGFSALFGISKHRYTLWTLMTEACLKLILAFWLTPQYGPVGMAIAATVPQVILYVTLFPVLAGKALTLPYASIIRTLLVSVIAGAATVAAVGIGALLTLPPDNWPGLVLDATLVMVALLLVGWRWILDQEDRLRARSYLGLGSAG